MKFSVLIPTHNRLELLKYAIESVAKQDYSDWEIIVSDNYSSQDIRGYIGSLNDDRIKFYRTDRFISVTDNWNAAIDRATGDYVIMIGDDDCLMKGYFSNILKIISEFSGPEFIFSNAFLYAYPGVLSDFPNGHFRIMGNCALWDQDKPYLLTNNVREKLLDETFNFRVAFSYNVQFATMSSDLIKRLRFQGKFYHTPYPDYYAMILLMEQAKTVVACPYPIVTVGISPKSFGFYHFSNKENEGIDFLNNHSEMKDQPELKDRLLPGTQMNNGWLISLNFVRKVLSRNIEINYGRYRRLQAVEFFYSINAAPNRSMKIRDFIRKLSGKDKVVIGFYLWLMLSIRNLLGIKFSSYAYKASKKILNSHPVYPQRRWNNKFKNISEAFEEIDPLQNIR